ncbi:MAG: ribonuclease P protein component [Salinivirgaceae bacterium]|jgi:ribonuclease P protein component|nr:ribonuclease P protein component [Salinivirgaceae bacterium]
MLSKETNQRLTFKKVERLKSRKTIESLFIQNKYLKIYPFKLVWLVEPNNENDSLKMGVSVAKRIFKSAVKRNLIKRKMRESLRLNKPFLSQSISQKNITLSFMLIYIGKEVVSFNEFDTKIKQLMLRLGDKIKN